MSFVLSIGRNGDRRSVEEAELPLAIGGEGSAIQVAGAGATPLAYLGVHEGRLFVQPAPPGQILHNGSVVADSAWCDPGDVIDVAHIRLRIRGHGAGLHIDIEDAAAGNITSPPLAVADARVSGETGVDEERIEPVSFRVAPEAAPRRRLLHPVRIAVGALLAILAFALWFVFTATSVRVDTTPAAEHIAFSGGLPAIEIGGRFLLRPGRYLLRVEQEGYRPLEREVDIARGPGVELEFELEKLPGILRIEVPMAGKLSIDGEPRGAVPGEFELSPGKHRLRIEAPRYLDYETEMEIEGGGRTQLLEAPLEPAWAVVNVTSEPAGAEVRIDGEARGITPLETEVLQGSWPLELRMQGFKTWSTDLQVKAGQPVAIGPVRLGLPDARLLLRSSPPGASVSVAGVYRGQTPLELELRPEIAQTVVLTRPGYESATRQLTLGPGEKRTVSIDLAGILGQVTVRAEPADAELYLDGEKRGRANQTLELPATSHEIEIRKPGYVTFRQTVTPRPGLPQVVTTKLLTPAQAKFAAIPQTVVTKAGQQLKLMPTGRFTMGSPRREAGRRANETEHPVELKRLFYMATRPVTNAEFRQFRSEHRSGFVGPNTMELDRQPVVKVSWQAAAAYCNWLSEQDGLPAAYVSESGSLVPARPMTIGYRMPTESEWEWVARYVDGDTSRRYPWGDELPVPPNAGNFADHTARVILQSVIPNYDDGYAVTSPVGSFRPNTLGLFDQGGNIAEWTLDNYTVFISVTQLSVDPLGPPEGEQRVIRGSSWRHSSATDLRLSARDYGNAARDDLGFRIARYVE